MTPKRLAMRLKALRQQRGLTQERLAARSRVTRVVIARLETARQDPRLSTLEKLARALGVPVTRLLE